VLIHFIHTIIILDQKFNYLPQVLGSEELRTGQPISLSGSFPSRLSSATLDLASHIASHLFSQVPRGNRAPAAATLPTSSDYALSQQHSSPSGGTILNHISRKTCSFAKLLGYYHMFYCSRVLIMCLMF
jgi:hypothetical protein